MARKAKHRKARSFGLAARWSVIVAAAVAFGGIAAATSVATASAAEQQHGSYNLVRTDFTPAYVTAFRGCWQANMPAGDWAALRAAEGVRGVGPAFYAEHPAALAAFTHCHATVPAETTTTTRVVTY